MKHKTKNILLTLTPLLGLALMLAIYIAVGTIKDINFAVGLRSIINQSVIVAVIATGAVFIYTLGSFDISLGTSALVSAMTGALAYNSSGSILLMLVVCIVTAVCISLVSSLLASVFNLPVFVTTVAMMSVLGAVSRLLVQTTGGATISIDSVIAAQYDTLPVKLIILIGYSLFCAFLFNYTKLGRREKFLGGNPLCAKLTGISEKKYAIIAFAIAGLGVGLGAFLTVLRSPTLNTNTAGDIGMNVMVAIVFGGMPISGGARSRVYAAIIGGFSMTVLSQTMSILLAASSAGLGISQIVRAVFFLALVYIASMNYRTKLLAR